MSVFRGFRKLDDNPRPPFRASIAKISRGICFYVPINLLDIADDLCYYYVSLYFYLNYSWERLGQLTRKILRVLPLLMRATMAADRCEMKCLMIQNRTPFLFV